VRWIAPLLSVGLAVVAVASAAPPPLGTIAFSSNRADHDLFVLDLRTKALTRITPGLGDDSNPSWSPDGGRIAYDATVNGNTDVYVVPASGGQPQRLTTDPEADLHPTWSPDGKQIAFASSRSGRSQIWVMNADGSDVHRLLAIGDISREPAWSPAVNRIAFARLDKRYYSATIWTVSPNGRGLRPVRGAVGWSPAWSPDARTIAFTCSQNGNLVCTARVAGGGARVVVGEQKSYIFSPAWSPNGRSLAYSVNGTLTAAAPDGSRERTLILRPRSGNGDASPVFSPDGTRVVFARDIAGIERLYTIDPDTNELGSFMQGPDPDAAPAWSPDRTRLAFLRTHGAVTYLAVADADGTAVRLLTRAMPTPASHVPARVSWSPDGSRIVFTRADEKYALDLWSIRADGGDLRRLTSTPNVAESRPRWATDGRIWFSTDGLGGDVWSSDANGRHPRRELRHASDFDVSNGTLVYTDQRSPRTAGIWVVRSGQRAKRLADERARRSSIRIRSEPFRPRAVAGLEDP
jgi:Tol biopolymer transport system component